jgi:SAM-dependent methyltransferase
MDFLWKNLRELPYFRAVLRSVECKFMSNVDLPSPVLDMGCGDGHFAEITYGKALDVGLDPSLKSMREAQTRGSYKLLLQADGARIPAPPAGFASAVSNSVLEHIPHLQEVLIDLGRVLQPGAPFAFTVPNPGYLSELSVPAFFRKLRLESLAKAYENWFMWMSRTRTIYYEEQWTDLLDRAGFDVVETVRYFSPAALHALEWGHYFGLPTVIARWLTGRWILVPTRWNLGLTEKMMRRYYEEMPSERGTYSFYLARRR